MNKIIQILIILALISVASAAVYVTTNPEAILSWNRPMPGPVVSPVTNMIECGVGYSNSCGIGTMEGNTLTKKIRHENTQAADYVGVVFLEIECEEGLVSNPSGGITDFKWINFTDPHGETYSCNLDTRINRISPNKIRITPTTLPYTFESGVIVQSNLTMEFIDYAYGYYTLTIFVNDVNTYQT